MYIHSAVVLAGGEGMRLRPLTKYRPKPMLPAGNRPILEHVLDALVDADITDLHLVVGHERDRVQNHFGSRHRGATITYHVQDKQLGSGHALLQAKEAIDFDFLVLNGDEIVGTETITQVTEAHTTTETITLAVIESEKAPEYGAVRLRDDRITEFVEKPATNDYRLLNRGVYAFGPSIFAEIESTPRTEGELSITDTISRLVERDASVKGVRTEGIWSAATYPWDLLTLASDVLSQGLVTDPGTDQNVYVADTARIHEDATLQGPVVIGADSTVGPQAVIGPDTAIGRNVTVGAGSVISYSLVDADSTVGPNATLRDTVTGQAVNIGPGTIVPGGLGDVRVNDTIHENETLGCVVADRTEIGGGVTISPGTLIGPEAKVQEGAQVTDDVNEGENLIR